MKKYSLFYKFCISLFDKTNNIMVKNYEVVMKKLSVKIISMVLSLICFTFIFSGCEQIVDHKIEVTSLMSTGTTSGRGTYKTGYEVTLTATPKSEENNFLAWTKNGYIVSQKNPYTFTASKETEGKYIAIFNSPDLSLLQLTSVSFSVPIGTNDSAISEKIVTKFTDFSIQVGEYSDVLGNLASSSDVEPTPPILYNNQFDILPYVFYKDKDYYFTISLTIEYTDTLSNATETKKFPTTIKVNFNQSAPSQNGNLYITQENGIYTVTRQNLTYDNNLIINETTPPVCVMTFSKLNLETIEE